MINMIALINEYNHYKNIECDQYDYSSDQAG